MQQGTANSFQEGAPQPASAVMMAVGTEDGDDVADQLFRRDDPDVDDAGEADSADNMAHEEGQDEAGIAHGGSSMAASGAGRRQAAPGTSAAARAADQGLSGKHGSGDFRGSMHGQNNAHVQRSAGHGIHSYAHCHQVEAELAAGESDLAKMEVSAGPAAAEGGRSLTRGEVRGRGNSFMHALMSDDTLAHSFNRLWW